MLPCVSKPSDLWHLDVLKHINSNYKRVVAPSFQHLDTQYWRGIGDFELGTKFPRLDGMLRDYPLDSNDKYPEVPVHMGTFAISRQWFNETGGWDSRLTQQGYGADLDFSLRTWLCGGEIRGSRLFGLAVPEVQFSDRNEYAGVRLAVSNWFGKAFLWKVGGLAHWLGEEVPFDESESYGRLLPVRDNSAFGGGHMSHVRGECKAFAWFLDRFDTTYKAGGLIPTSVSHIKDQVSGLCLEWRPQSLTPDVFTYNMMTDFHGRFRNVSTFNGDLALRPCTHMAPNQMFHRTNLRPAAGSARVHDSKCCSGITVWDQDACLTMDFSTGTVKTSPCVSDGSNEEQFAVFSDSMIQMAGGQCMKAMEEAIQLAPMQCGVYYDDEDDEIQIETLKLSQQATISTQSSASSMHRRYAAPLTAFREHDELGLQHLDTGLCLKKFMRNDTNGAYTARTEEENENPGYESGGDFTLALTSCVDLSTYGDSDADYSLAHVQSLLHRGSYTSRVDLAKYVFRSFAHNAQSHCTFDGATYEFDQGQLRSPDGQCLGIQPNMFYQSNVYNPGLALGLDTCGFYKDGGKKIARAGQLFRLERDYEGSDVVAIRDPHAGKCIFQNRRNGRLAFEPCDSMPQKGYRWLMDPRDNFFKYDVVF